MVFPSQEKDKMPAVLRISYGESIPDNPLHKRHRKHQFLSSISKMTDEEIVQASIKNANEQALKSKAARALDKGPFMFIAATSIACGALNPGKLSSKVAAGALTAALGGVIAGLSNPVHRAVDAIFNKNNKEEKAPTFTQFAVELGALAGVTALALKGGQKGGAKLAKTFAPTAKEIAQKMSKAASTIDTSVLGKQTEKLSEGFQKFTANHPKVSSLIKNTALFAPAAVFIAKDAALTNKVEQQRNETAISNINKLVLCREYAKAITNDNEAKSVDIKV